MNVQANDSTIIYSDKPQRPFIPFRLPLLDESQQECLDRAKKFALEQSVQKALSKQVATIQNHDFNNLKRSQAIILISRIYVGSIHFEVGEDELRKSFSYYGTIKAVTMSHDATTQKHKGFAFIEYDRPEAALLALEFMNGSTVCGRGIKVGRPSNAPQTTDLERMLREDPDNHNRIYIAGIHKALFEEDLTTVFEAFGKIKSCDLIYDPRSPKHHLGFGYIEFESEEAVIGAVSSMNGFELAGMKLRLTRALTSIRTDLTSSAAITTEATMQKVHAVVQAINQICLACEAADAAAGVGQPASKKSRTLMGPQVPFSKKFSVEKAQDIPPPGVFDPKNLEESLPLPTQVPFVKKERQDSSDILPQHKTMFPIKTEDDGECFDFPITEDDPLYEILGNKNKPLLPEIGQINFSNVVVLDNMITVEDVDDAFESEVSEECSKFGYVVRVVVHINEKKNLVRIFVHFDSSEGAINCVQVMNGRFFAGHQIQSKLYPFEKFQLHEFDD